MVMNILRVWNTWNQIYRVPEDGITSVYEFLQAVDKFEKAFNAASIGTFVYRGENATFETFMLPSMGRYIFEKGEELSSFKCNTNFTKQEEEEIRSFKKSEQGRKFKELLEEHAIDWLPLAQHYGYKTRLLDVSYNPLVALYFACEGEDHIGEDGWVFLINANSLRPQTKPINEIGKFDLDQGIPTQYHKLFDGSRKDVYHLFDFSKTPIYKKHLHKRINAQCAAFIWWHPFTKRNNQNQIFPILINKNAKQKILHELDIKFCINRDSLFPD